MQGGCIIRAQLLDDIKQAYDRHENLHNLLVDQEFGKRLAERQAAWRSVVGLAVQHGLAAPGMMTSLAYFDTYRRGTGALLCLWGLRGFRLLMSPGLC